MFDFRQRKLYHVVLKRQGKTGRVDLFIANHFLFLKLQNLVKDPGKREEKDFANC